MAVRTALSLNLVDSVTLLFLSVDAVLRIPFRKDAKVRGLPKDVVTRAVNGRGIEIRGGPWEDDDGWGFKKMTETDAIRLDSTWTVSKV